MENPIKMDDWGGYLFLETSISHDLSGFTTIPETVVNVRPWDFWLPSSESFAKGLDAVGGDVARACGAGGCQVRGGAGWAVIQVVRVWYLVCLMASQPTPKVPGTPMRNKAVIRPY